MIKNPPDDDPPDDAFGDPAFDDDASEPFDPDAIRACEYWRCGDLFEQRTVNQIFCRKACRSRQRKWERAQDRKRRRAAAKANRKSAERRRTTT